MKKTIANMRAWLNSTEPMQFPADNHVELLRQIAEARVRRWSKAVPAGLFVGVVLSPVVLAALGASEREALVMLDLGGTALLYLAPLCLFAHVLSSALWHAGFRPVAAGGGDMAQGHSGLKQ